MLPSRVIIDPNVFISALIAKRDSSAVAAAQAVATDKLILVACPYLLAELTEVAHREKFRKYFSIERAELLAGDMLSPPWVGPTKVDSDWPSIDWDRHNSAGAVTVRAIGLLLLDAQLDMGERLVNFDHAAGRWRRLVRDWLAALAGGPTDHLMLEHGDTVWADQHLNQDLIDTSYRAGKIYEPTLLTTWEFEHGFLHAEMDDPPPLAWTLLTAAMRSAAIGDTRNAVIDAATAVEVALTEALRSRLSPEASPQVVAAILDRSRMLGARLELAREFALPLPESIQATLVRPRNNLVHRGEEVSARQVESAVAAALEV